MASVCTVSKEDKKSEGTVDMPVLRSMIDDLRESTVSFAQTSNSSSTADDLFISQALALPQLSETFISTEGIDSTDDHNVSDNKRSDNLIDALNSSGKCMSIILDSVPSTTTPLPEEQFANATTSKQTSDQQIDNTQSGPAPPLPITATTGTSQQKQHIMISYNRSCEETCRKIRNNLRQLKYKVWMDVYDMRDNFIVGMAKAIRNSYIVLMCINRNYDDSFWCKKEAEDIAIKRIKFIPCFMEKPFPLEDWLDFLVGGNVWVDFSEADQYDNSFTTLIKEITFVEEKLATYPRETPPITPSLTTNPTAATFDAVMGNFKTWVEENRDNLKRFNRKQSAQLINQLIQGLKTDSNTPDDANRTELLQQLLSSTSGNQNELFPHLFQNLTTANYPMIKGLLFIMALWAVRVVFKKN